MPLITKRTTNNSNFHKVQQWFFNGFLLCFNVTKDPYWQTLPHEKCHPFWKSFQILFYIYSYSKTFYCRFTSSFFFYCYYVTVKSYQGNKKNFYLQLLYNFWTMSCLPYLCRIHTCFCGCKWTHTRFFTQKKTKLRDGFFMIQDIIFIIFSTAWQIQTNAFILCISAVYQIMVTRSNNLEHHYCLETVV